MLPSKIELSDALKQAGANIRSPLAMSGLMISIVRHRFHSKWNLPFVWKPVSDTDLYTEHPDSTIRIEAGGEAGRDQGVSKPGIYVVRQPVHVQQLAVDDMSSFTLATGDRTFMAMGNTGFTFICESLYEGTSSAIADIVMSTFMMGSNIIESRYNIHKLGPYSLSATSSTRKETEVYETHVSVGMQYNLKWVNLNLAPMFKEMMLKSSSNEQYFVETYTKSVTNS